MRKTLPKKFWEFLDFSQQSPKRIGMQEGRRVFDFATVFNFAVAK
jgi:hypothetical protein